MKIKLDVFEVQAGSLGRIPTVNMTPAYSGGLLLLPGFEYPVVIDLAPLAETHHEQNIPILRNHHPDREIGHTERIMIDGDTVSIEGKLSFDNEDVREIVQTSKAGKRWQVSVGSGSVPASMQRFIPEGERVTINGQVQTGPIIIVQTPIREVSFVPAGADLHNTVTIKATSLKGETIMTFEQWATEKGIDLSTLDDTNKAAIEKIFESETAEPVEAEGTEDNNDKQDEKPIKASAMHKGRKVSDLGTAAVGTAYRVGAAPVIEASLLMSGGVTDREIEKLGYDQRTIDQAVSRENRGMGLQSLFHACIAAAGMHYPGGRCDNGLIETAFEASNQLRRRGIQAGSLGTFSSVNLPGILSNVANKSLLNAYQRIESAAMQISYIATANDFKEMSHYQFEMDGTLQVVDDGQDIPHVSLKETEYKNRIHTRGALVALTRQMIVNDDLEAFLRIPQEFGRKAAQTLEYVAFSTLLENLATLFKTANGNKMTKKLSIAGLDEASKIFGEQKDKNGGFTLIQPAMVLVPPALGATAKTLYTSSTVNETTTAGKPSPVDNPWAGSFKPVVSPFLGSAFSFKTGTGTSEKTYTGSDPSWLLLADPLDLAVLEIAFLNGQRNPIIESGEMDFNKLGMAWRCYFDFGVGLLDPRAGVYSDGTVA